MGEGRQGYVMRATGLNRRSVRRGFTLLEVILATIIVGTGITAAMQLFVTCTQQNQTAVGMTVAMNLANNVQELMSTAFYADPNAAVGSWGLESGETLGVGNNPATLDVDDFDGAVFNPPKDASWADLNDNLLGAGRGLTRYTQKVHVTRVKKSDLTSPTSGNADEGVLKVVVEVWYKPNAASPSGMVYSMSFLRFNDKGSS